MSPLLSRYNKFPPGLTISSLSFILTVHMQCLSILGMSTKFKSNQDVQHGLCPPWGLVCVPALAQHVSICPPTCVNSLNTALLNDNIVFLLLFFLFWGSEKFNGGESPGFLLSRWWIYQRECRDCLRFFLESRTFKPSNSSLNEFIFCSYFSTALGVHTYGVLTFYDNKTTFKIALKNQLFEEILGN